MRTITLNGKPFVKPSAILAKISNPSTNATNPRKWCYLVMKVSMFYNH